MQILANTMDEIVDVLVFAWHSGLEGPDPIAPSSGRFLTSSCLY